MSTRATIRFATREEGVSFNEHPQSWHAQFYKHHDGYPEGLGVDIAESFNNYRKLENWEVESLDIVHSDIEYLYYVWQCHGKSEPWISIFEMVDYSMPSNGGDGKCIFVGTPDMLLKKYAPEQEKDFDCSEHGCQKCCNFTPFPGECCKNTN